MRQVSSKTRSTRPKRNPGHGSVTYYSCYAFMLLVFFKGCVRQEFPERSESEIRGYIRMKLNNAEKQNTKRMREPSDNDERTTRDASQIARDA